MAVYTPLPLFPTVPPAAPVSPAPPATLIVLPGALPPAPAAAELASRIAQPDGPAPTLLRWLRRTPAEQSAFEPARAGCTATEYAWLASAGLADGHELRDAPGMPAGAALGPLQLGGAAAGTPCWLADLAHVQIGRDGPTLAPADTLMLDADDGAALHAAALPVLHAHGFDALPLTPRRWQVRPPPGFALRSASPALVAGDTLEHWWPREATARAWRGALNEIQMVWHAHAVNAARERRGLPAVNALWLHGGAPPLPPRWQPAPRFIAGDPDWLAGLAAHAGVAYRADLPAAVESMAGAAIGVGTLDAAARDGDWLRWLDALAALDRDLLAPLDAALRAGRLRAIDLILPDRLRIARLCLRARPLALRWLPSRTLNWTDWWLPLES